MTADLKKTHFELFELPAAFDLDQAQLAARYRELQRAVHPDRYASASDQERRLSVQLTAQVNEAYQTLRAPLRRARYLLALHGVVIDDQDTAMDPLFLMEQMELREALAEVRGAADPFAALDGVRGRLEGMERAFVASLSVDLGRATAEALGAAKQTVRKMQFIQRLLEECGDLEERLVHS